MTRKRFTKSDQAVRYQYRYRQAVVAPGGVLSTAVLQPVFPKPLMIELLEMAMAMAMAAKPKPAPTERTLLPLLQQLLLSQ